MKNTISHGSRLAGLLLAACGLAATASTATAAQPVGKIGGAQPVTCDRECLRSHVTQFLWAMVKHDASKLPVADNVRITEDADEKKSLKDVELFRRVIFPACLPQIVTSLRIALGIAWLVVVAAEMIAVNSGLGYLIIDARNAGKRYDLVVAGMVMIGLIGLVLDVLVRRLETFDEVRWGYANRQ